MGIGVRWVRCLSGVPRDRNSMIVQLSARGKWLQVQIQFRRTGGRNRAVDEIVHEKCPANQAAALQLAVDLALLGECERVYVLGDIANASLPPAPRAAR